MSINPLNEIITYGCSDVKNNRFDSLSAFEKNRMGSSGRKSFTVSKGFHELQYHNATICTVLYYTLSCIYCSQANYLLKY